MLSGTMPKETPARMEFSETTSDIMETWVLEYPPTCGNGLAWNKDDGRIAVVAGMVVVVFRPEGGKNRAFSLVAWKEGIPSLGDDEDSFRRYRDAACAYPSTSDDVKTGASKGTSQDVGRGRTFESLYNVLRKLSDIDQKSDCYKIQTSISVSELLDDAYFSSEAPKVMSIAWSPSMCSNLAGSLLAVVFEDSSTMIYSISESMSALWMPVMNLCQRGTESDGLPSKCVAIAWSDEIAHVSTSISLISVVLANGDVDLYRIFHVSISLDAPALEKRLSYIGRVHLPDECITQVKFTVIRADCSDKRQEDDNVVAVLGCRSGAVVAWNIPASRIVNMHEISPGQGVRNVLDKKHYTYVVEKDGLMVSSLDCCVILDSSSSRKKVLIGVGKTVGVVQMYLSQDILASKGILTSLKKGDKITVPRTLDSHTISGITCIMNGTLVIATSRLGNMMTLQVPQNGSKLATVALDPVHHCKGPGMSSYKGFGFYGIAASPGGNFVAVAKQAQEPDQEYRRQMQIHQMITQGYVHILSLVGPGAEVSSIPKALTSCVDRWAKCVENRNIYRSIMWDIERLSNLLLKMSSDSREISEVLKLLQEKSGIVVNEGNVPGIVGVISPGYVTALIHVLRCLNHPRFERIVDVADLEMVMMRDNIERIISEEASKQNEVHILSALLALDFIISHEKTHKWIFSEDFVAMARAKYGVFGEDVVTDEHPPKRLVSPSIKNLVASMGSGSIQETLLASISTSKKNPNESCIVSRCPASLLVMLDGGEWLCQSCQRCFGIPTRPRHFLNGSFMCTLCAGIVEINKYFYS